MQSLSIEYPPGSGGPLIYIVAPQMISTVRDNFDFFVTVLTPGKADKYYINVFLVIKQNKGIIDIPDLNSIALVDRVAHWIVL